MLIISWPRITLFNNGGSIDKYYGVIATIASTIFAAMATIFVRSLVKTEKSPTIVIYFSSMASLLSSVSTALAFSAKKAAGKRVVRPN